MNDEWIIETAERYGRLETLEDHDTGCHVSKWVFSEDGLRCFVQEITEKEVEEHNDLIAHAVEVLRRQVKPASKSRQQPKTPLADYEILQVAAKAPPVYPWLIQGDVTLDHVRKMAIDYARAIERKIWEKA
jgi:hypothetical protein